MHDCEFDMVMTLHSVLGLLAACVMTISGMAEPAESYKGMFVFRAEGSIEFQLGGFIIGPQKGMPHEYGHRQQEILLGAYYLPLVGMTSAIGHIFLRGDYTAYYSMWSEKWADALGGVHR